MNMPLVLARSTIRDWRRDDAESLAHHANNRAVWVTVSDIFPFPYSLGDANAFLDRTFAQERRTNFAIEIDGAAVGGIGVKLQSDVQRYTAELGYWLGQEFWGRGIMTEAVVAFSEWAMNAFELHRLYAQAYSSNPASARVLEKAGFKFEGRLTKAIFKDGRDLDALLYAKTR